MTKSQHEKERQWNVRKRQQNPHGKVKSFEELGEDITPNVKKERRGE